MQCVSESDVPHFRKKRYAVRLKPKRKNTRKKSMTSRPTKSIMIISTRLQSKTAAHLVYKSSHVSYMYNVSTCVYRIYHMYPRPFWLNAYSCMQRIYHMYPLPFWLKQDAGKGRRGIRGYWVVLGDTKWYYKRDNTRY